MPLEGKPLAKHAPVHDLLRAGLDGDPDGLALASLDRRLTWSELERRALAASYRRLGLGPGDRVASPINRPELVVHYLACLRGGLVATPLNYRYATPQIEHALQVSGASLLVSHVERRGDLCAGSIPGTRCASTTIGTRVSSGASGWGKGTSTRTAPGRSRLFARFPGGAGKTVSAAVEGSFHHRAFPVRRRKWKSL